MTQIQRIYAFNTEKKPVLVECTRKRVKNGGRGWGGGGRGKKRYETFKNPFFSRSFVCRKNTNQGLKTFKAID